MIPQRRKERMGDSSRVGWARFCLEEVLAPFGCAYAVSKLVSAWAQKTCPPYNGAFISIYLMATQ
jgi:hypothetical protein